MRKHLFHLLSALIALTLTFIACGGGGKKDVAVTGVSLNKPALTLAVGGTEKLLPAISPADATNKNVTWSSSDTAIATVSNDGAVTGAAVGSATITVATVDGNKTADCNVTVIVPVESVNLDEDQITLMLGEQLTLTKTVLPVDATNTSVAWETSDRDIASVSSGGVVTAMGGGNAVITVTSVENTSARAECAVTVLTEIPVSGITLDNTEMTLNTGQAAALRATVFPADAANQAVVWFSDNKTAVEVSQTGELTALAAGRAKITVTSEAYPAICAECAITVLNTTVYASGNMMEQYSGENAFIWVNGEFNLLNAFGNMSYGDCVFVSENGNEYVGGQEYDDNWNVIPVLYMNGFMKSLEIPQGSVHGRIYSVFVAGGVEYSAGFCSPDHNIATLWTGNAYEILSNEQSEAYSVYVDGGKVYVAGVVGTWASRAATLWVDKVPRNLPASQGSTSVARSVFVSGQNVYVAGVETTQNYVQYAALWINNEIYRLTDESSNAQAYSIYVSGDKLYVAGEDAQKARLWEIRLNSSGSGIQSAQTINLHQGDVSRANSVFASGSDVYVAGYIQPEEWGDRKATLWRGGYGRTYTPTRLTEDGDSSATGVFVKQQL